jgi:hypothetical protein
VLPVDDEDVVAVPIDGWPNPPGAEPGEDVPEVVELLDKVGPFERPS